MISKLNFLELMAIAFVALGAYKITHDIIDNFVELASPRWEYGVLNIFVGWLFVFLASRRRKKEAAE